MHIDDEWEAFHASLDFFSAVFGEDIGRKVADIMVKLARDQELLLIKGVVDGSPSPNIYKLNGFGYLMGVGMGLLLRLSMTQYC